MTCAKLIPLLVLLSYEVCNFFQALKHHISDLEERIGLLKSELVWCFYHFYMIQLLIILNSSQVLYEVFVVDFRRI